MIGQSVGPRSYRTAATGEFASGTDRSDHRRVISQGTREGRLFAKSGPENVPCFQRTDNGRIRRREIGPRDPGTIYRMFFCRAIPDQDLMIHRGFIDFISIDRHGIRLNRRQMN